MRSAYTTPVDGSRTRLLPGGGQAPVEGPDPDLSVQERLRRQRSLRVAILTDAISCLERNTRVPRDAQLRKQALRWVRSSDDLKPFSFAMVCEALGVDGAAIRRELLARHAGVHTGSGGQDCGTT